MREVVEVRHRWRSRPACGLCALVVVVLTAAGCSSAGGKPSAAPSTVGTTSTTTQAQLDAVIVGQWLLSQQALTALQRDPTSSAANLLLSDYVTEPLLSYSRTQFAARARDGLADIGTISFGHPRVTSVSGSKATVVSCINDGLALIIKATGKPLPGTDPNPEVEGTTSTMQQSPSGVWMLSDSTKDVGSCAGA